MWSAGVVLYEMLTGELPFENDKPLVASESEVPSELKSTWRKYQSIVEAQLEWVRYILQCACHCAFFRLSRLRKAQVYLAQTPWARNTLVLGTSKTSRNCTLHRACAEIMRRYSACCETSACSTCFVCKMQASHAFVMSFGTSW